MTRPRARTAPLQLQLIELSLAAASFFLAVHLGSKVSVALVIAGVLVGALALFTQGPLGVVGRLTPGFNLVLLGVIGGVVTLTPIAFAAERSWQAVAVLESGAFLIALTIVGTLRFARPPLRPEPPTSIGPNGLPPALRAGLRMAGRTTSRARSGASRRVPIVARRAGRAFGSRRAPRR